MGAFTVIYTLAVAFCHMVTEILGACNKPALSANSYTLTGTKNSYAFNETYEIYCNPGYDASGGSDLICGSNNQWSLEPPTCTPSEGTYPWWMLLVAVALVILLVSCILPRFLQCCLSKTKKSRNNKSNDVERNDDNQQNNGYDDDSDDDDRADSPVPNFSKHKKMSNMEFMSKLHKDVDKKGLKRATKNAVF